MFKKIGIPVAVGAFMLASSVSPASAKGGDIKVQGRCTGSERSVLKLSPRPTNHLTEVEWVVEEAVPASTWRVTIKDNGTVVVRRNKTARA